MSVPYACDLQKLTAMLDSDAEAKEYPELLRHVEQCAYCQHHLETLAADADLWRHATQVLSEFSSTDDFRSKAESVGCRRQADDPPLEWTESMARQLLQPSSHPELLGRIGRYEVERLIGSGGMGVVFKAFDTELNRPVAIKILAPYLAGSGPARQRFAREAKAAAAVVHEHVVPIHNVETDGQSPYLVMRYVSGESLQARIDRLGALDACEILRIAMQTASGLAAAHAQGVIHRDIKPSNILVEPSVERSLITDFGLARAADDASLTQTGYHPGTPQFMSPEQARGDVLDPRSDLFSLGSVMYTMATGRPPFRAETSYGILRRITDSQPHDIQEINPNIPSWLCGVIRKLMQKSPDDRYQTAEALSEILSHCLAYVQRPASCRLPAEVLELESRTQSTWYRIRYRRIAIALATTCAIVAAIALASPWIRNQGANRVGFVLDPSSAYPSSSVDGASIQRERSANDTEADQHTNAPKPVILGPKILGPPEPSEVLREKLSTPITIQHGPFNLTDGVAEVLKTANVRYRVNQGTFSGTDVSPASMQTFSGSGATFSILQRFLDRFQASVIVHDSEVEIVSSEYAQQHPVLRYYELSLVLPGNQQLPAVVHAIEQCGKADLWVSKGGGPFTVSVVDSMLLVKADEVTHHQIEQLLSQLSASRAP